MIGHFLNTAVLTVQTYLHSVYGCSVSFLLDRVVFWI